MRNAHPVRFTLELASALSTHVQCEAASTARVAIPGSFVGT